MRSLRIKIRKGTGVYHCISRSVAGAFLLDDEAKTMFRKMLWEVAEFCGVEVLAYCVMTNHFHVLVRVAERGELSREEVLRRYAVLYTHSNTPGYPDASVLRGIFAGEADGVVEDWMEKLTARMNDVSEWMKTLKQRFTMWYNKRHKRFGTLWSDRFKSVLVQNNTLALRTVAAYIDLNPVRAGLAADPAEYAWCSYGEAVSGSECARGGLVGATRGGSWEATLASYRQTLCAKEGRLALEKTKAATDAGGSEIDDFLRRRHRVFTEGKALGSPEFVEAVGQQIRSEREGSEMADRSGNVAETKDSAAPRLEAFLEGAEGKLCALSAHGRVKSVKSDRSASEF